MRSNDEYSNIDLPETREEALEMLKEAEKYGSIELMQLVGCVRVLLEEKSDDD